MAELKTKKTRRSVEKFLNGLSEPQREDCWRLLELFKEATGETPAIWGEGMVGFGSYKYKYPTGRTGEWFATGFAPRKQNLVLYIMPGFGKFPTLMNKLGKYKTGKSCLYIKNLADVHLPSLKTLIKRSVRELAKHYP